MGMDHRLMPVPMRMRLCDRPIMLVLVMLIMGSCSNASCSCSCSCRSARCIHSHTHAGAKLDLYDPTAIVRPLARAFRRWRRCHCQGGWQRGRFARWRKFDPRKSQSVLMSQIAVANSAKFTVKQLPTPCIKLAAADLVPLNRARHKLDVLGSLDPRVRKLLGSSSKKAGRYKFRYLGASRAALLSLPLWCKASCCSGSSLQHARAPCVSLLAHCRESGSRRSIPEQSAPREPRRLR